MRFFFYGTLMDVDVLTAVIGRRIGPARIRDAVLDGFRRVYRRGAWYPILLDDPDGRVKGVVVSDLTVAVAGEGTVEAQVYLTKPGVPASDQPWDLESWRRRHRPGYLAQVRRSGSPRR